MARDLSRATDGGTVTAEQAREHEGATVGTSASKGMLTAFAADALNIAIAVTMLVAIYWLLGREFPGGMLGVSALLGSLIVLDAVATAYDVWVG